MNIWSSVPGHLCGRVEDVVGLLAEGRSLGLLHLVVGVMDKVKNSLKTLVEDKQDKR